MQIWSSIFIIITICDFSMNPSPPGNGRPFINRRVYEYKRHLKFLDQADYDFPARES